MRKVLFIAYLFPPMANSGTRRSLSFVNHLPDHGWQPTVLTQADPPARSCDPALLDEVRAGTRIERVALAGTILARGLARLLPSAALRARVAAALEWRFNSLLQTPDEVLAWYPQAVARGVALHREIGFDVIYASGWPWTAFLVARAIAKRTGVPYVLDYRDTWTPTGTAKWEAPSRMQARFGPWLQRLAARKAAALITVTEMLVPVIARDAARSSVHCITNGYEPADFPAAPAPPAAASAERHYCIAYTGIYRDDYGLHELYRALRKLKDEGSPALQRIRVRAAGFKPGPARALGIDDVVEELGYVPHAEATRMMHEADLLYLSVPTGFYASASLPGKLFEYMGSANPILAVVPQGSEVARVLADVGGALRVDPGDETAMLQVVRRLAAGEAAAMCAPRKRDRLQRYTRSATTASLAGVLEAACVSTQVELAL
jgi:glycosyltransferase involved in cell wall biosynthesis